MNPSLSAGTMTDADFDLPPTPPPKRRQVGWGALSVSILVHAVFAILAIFVLYRWVDPPANPPPNIIPGGGGGGNGGEVAKKVQTKMRQSVATTAVSRRIFNSAAATFTLPDSASELMEPSLPMSLSDAGAGQGGGAGGGSGGGIGKGIGPGTGPGMGPGLGKGAMSMTPFGSRDALAGAMPGRFYDFKQTRQGKAVEDYVVTRYEDFGSRVTHIHDDNFRPSAFRKFFEAPDTLYLTQIAIPLLDAGAGPSFFNVADKVKPSGWFVHYNGKVSTTRDITFRFVGTGDDYLGVAVKGRTKLIAAWPGVRPQVIGNWEPEDPIEAEAPTPLPGGPVTKGQWVKMKRGEELELDIGIGECPGGKVGFVLMIEEKGVDYRKTSGGQQVLPLFTTEPISTANRERITKDFPNWEFEWDNVPVFATSKDSRMGLDALR